MTSALSPQTLALVNRLLARMAPPVQSTVVEWAERYRHMAPGTTAMPGPYSVAATPYLRGVLAAVDEPGTWKVVAQKSAQVGWTDGVVNNVIGRMIHLQPCSALVLFPREKSARDYAAEKFEPMVAATPELRARVDLRSRARGQGLLHRGFSGGFLKLVGSNSPGEVKSTPARLVVVEEPDDAATDVRGQGDAIKLAEERSKSFSDRLVLTGGTPSVSGLSAIEQEMRSSDQRQYYVPCHACDEAHPLTWAGVTWHDDPTYSHPVYGHARPETARYACPACGVLWEDAERVRNVARADELQRTGATGVGWVATAEFRGVAGFYLSELLSSFEASRLHRLVERYLEARHESENGEHGALIAFHNSALGLPWEMQSDAPDEDRLAERGMDYQPMQAPHGVLVVTAGVDVQHDRLHVHLWGWGRGMESWLLWRGVIPGRTVDPRDLVWQALDERLASPVLHASGAQLRVCSLSIDSSDGQTSDAVYEYVRRLRRDRRALRAMAVKGASVIDREIYTAPKRLDFTRADKAARYGLTAHIVGVSRAKDSIAGALKLTGEGPGRMHWYATVEPEFFAQMTSEVKWPGRGGRMQWQVKAGAANEDLDCAVYSRHAAMAVRVHVWTERQWQAAERTLVQPDLLAPRDDPSAATPPEPNQQARRQRQPRRTGWMSRR